MRIGTSGHRNHGKGLIGCCVLKRVEMDKSMRVLSLLQYRIEKHHVIFQRRKLDGQIAIHFLTGQHSKRRDVGFHYPSRWIAFEVPETDRATKALSQETTACAHGIVEFGSSNVGPPGMLRGGFPSSPNHFVEPAVHCFFLFRVSSSRRRAA